LRFLLQSGEAGQPRVVERAESFGQCRMVYRHYNLGNTYGLRDGRPNFREAAELER